MSNRSREISRQELAHDGTREQSYQHAISWLTVWASFAFATLIGFSRLSYGLLLPALRADLGGSFSVLGTLATVNFVGYLIGTLFMPMLLARIQNRVRLNLLALLATNLLMVVSASSLTIWQSCAHVDMVSLSENKKLARARSKAREQAECSHSACQSSSTEVRFIFSQCFWMPLLRLIGFYCKRYRC